MSRTGLHALTLTELLVTLALLSLLGGFLLPAVYRGVWAAQVCRVHEYGRQSVQLEVIRAMEEE